MKTAGTALAALAAALTFAFTAAAQESPQRFHLERTEKGFIRLDRQSGAMSLCREENGTLACRMAADERAAYEAELERLEKRVEALERRMAAGGPADLPSEAEIDRSISIMERFMRAFMGLVEEFRQKGGEEPPPERT